MHLIPGLHPGFIFGGNSLIPLGPIRETDQSRILSGNPLIIPPEIEVGDFMVLDQYRSNVGSPPPAFVPDGFTLAGEQTWTESGLGMRWGLLYRILTATDKGRSVELDPAVSALIFRGNRAIRTATHHSYVGDFSTGNVGPETITASGADQDNLTVGVFRTTGNSYITDAVFYPDADATWNLGSFPGDRTYAWLNQGAMGASDVIINGNNWANRNFVYGCYFQFT